MRAVRRASAHFGRPGERHRVREGRSARPATVQRTARCASSALQVCTRPWALQRLQEFVHRHRWLEQLGPLPPHGRHDGSPISRSPNGAGHSTQASYTAVKVECLIGHRPCPVPGPAGPVPASRPPGWSERRSRSPESATGPGGTRRDASHVPVADRHLSEASEPAPRFARRCNLR